MKLVSQEGSKAAEEGLPQGILLDALSVKIFKGLLGAFLKLIASFVLIEIVLQVLQLDIATVFCRGSSELWNGAAHLSARQEDAVVRFLQV